LASGLKT